MTIFDIIAIILFLVVVSIIIWLNITCSRDTGNKPETFYPMQQQVNDVKQTIYEIKSMDNNNTNNIFEYGDYICHRKPTDVSLNTANTINNTNTQNSSGTTNQIKFSSKCPNKSLNEMHKSGTMPLQPNKVCSQSSSNNYTKSNAGDTRLEIEDPARYYQMMYAKMPAKFDDGRFAGYNYYSFPGYGTVRNIGQIPLEKTNDYPIGANN